MTRRETVFESYNRQKNMCDERVKNGIEQNRKAYANLSFTDKEGRPLKNVKFNAALKKHDFKFGCNIFMLDEFETEEKNAKYREMFADVFNYAIVPFYWNGLEPERGKPRYEKTSPRVYRRPAPDLCVEYCKQNGIGMKGHCLVYDSFSPSWLPRDVAKIWNEYDRHFEEISSRYKYDINDWDIINETICWDVYSPQTTPVYKERNFVEKSFELARHYFPGNNLFINEAAGIWELFRYDRSYFYLLLDRLTRENVSFDSIGLQMHIFCPKDNEMERGEGRYNPIKAFNVLDTFGEFGKPLHLSEVTIPAYFGDEQGEEIQAELLCHLYKMWFSHKSCEGIAYWNLVDGYAHGAPLGDMTSGENVYAGGLLNFDMSEKAAFKMLKKLVKEEWTTKCEDRTNDFGKACFRGFKGVYDLTYYVDGREYKTEFSVTDDVAQIKIVAE